MEEEKALTPEEAAEKVREHWDKATDQMSPEEQHEVRYLMKVCHHLGVEANPMNVRHVASVLEHLGVPRFTGDEYPKALNTTDKLGRSVEVKYPMGHEKAGMPVVFANAEEEAAWGSEEKPVEA